MKIVRNRNSGKNTWTIRTRDGNGKLLRSTRWINRDASSPNSFEDEATHKTLRTTRASLRESSNTSFSPGAVTSSSSKENKKLSPSKRRFSSPSKDENEESKTESNFTPSDGASSELKQKRKVGRPPKKKFRKLVHFDDNEIVNDSTTTSFRVSLTELAQLPSRDLYEKKPNTISSGSETDTHPENVGRELRPRRTLNSSSQSFSYSETRPYSKRDSPSYGTLDRTRVMEDSGQINSSTSNRQSLRRKFLDRNTDVQQSDTAVEDEDETRENDEEEQHSEGRRYPVRNRRNTSVYQVQCPQNNSNHHPHHRRWMTTELGHETTRRMRRHNGRYPRHPGSDSASSSSSQSNSDTSSDSLRNPLPTYRKHSASSSYWIRPTTGNNEQSSRLNAVDEQLFEQRRTKSIMHARSELMPINLNQLDHGKSALNKRLLAGTSLADIEPMNLDTSIGFDQIAGHECHILALKESIILPLMYPEIFSQFGIAPPQGCLFTGPPGTGKTLLARALANECTRLNQTDNQGNIKRRPIAFFMRKGADCLSKWVGESERHLRLLFDQAYRMRPSIIFFDEIDGLAPVRSSKQDQIHSSIVSTLLSLMDGLDNRAEVVVIGATNRPDSIDPALRRPGRFDREFQFRLPIESVRKQILAVHTRKWNPKPDDDLLNQLATATNNFSGADLKALTTEACLCCLRRCYPQVYNSQVKLALDFRYLVVNRSDWFKALQVVRASSERCDIDLSAASLAPSANALSATSRIPLLPNFARLLQANVDLLANHFLNALQCPIPNSSFDPISKFSSSFKFPEDSQFYVPKSRILLSGNVSDYLMDAVWHRLESIQVYTLNLANLLAFPTSIGICPEAAVAQIVSAIRCAVKKSPPLCIRNQFQTSDLGGVIIYLPRVDILFRRLSTMTASYLVERLDSLIQEIDSDWMMRINLVPQDGSSSGYSTISSHYSSRILLVATVTRPEISMIYSDKLNECDQVVKQTKDKPSPAELKNSEIRGNSNSKSNIGRDTNFHIPNGFCTSNALGNHGRLRTAEEKPNHLFSSKVKTSTKLSPNLALHENYLDSDMDRHHHHYHHHAQPRHPNQHSLLISEMNSNLFPQDASDAENEQEDQDDESSTIFPNSPEERNPNAKLIMTNHHHHWKVDPLLTSLFNKEQVDLVRVKSPDSQARSAFYGLVLLNWCKIFTGPLDSAGLSVEEERDEKDRPPTPEPVPNTPDPIENYYKRLTKDELAELERQESQLFRRLRQVLRRVVAHLLRHRRFVVFSRPVQIDEAPDYYEVIKQPIDLGMVRDKIDSHQYTNVDDFMRDLELIHLNALEYNPANVPRSRDIRSRAFEFWDEACLCLEEELDPPDLNEKCKAATLARSMRMSKQNTSDDTPNSKPTKLSSSSSSAVVTTTSTHSKRKPDPTSTMTTTTTKPDTPQPKLPPPLPQGDRYSRRLHGEPPILGTEDVQQLEAVSRRRSCSHHPETGNSDCRSPTLKIKESIDLDSSLPKTPSDTMKSKSSVEHNYELVTSSPISNATKTNQDRTSNSVVNSQSVLKNSRNLETSQITPIKDQSSASSITNYHPPQIKLDYPKLQELHRTVVSQTEGWSTEQLINLYTDFVKVVLWRYGRLMDRSNMHLDLEHVFKFHADVASTRPNFA